MGPRLWRGSYREIQYATIFSYVGSIRRSTRLTGGLHLALGRAFTVLHAGQDIADGDACFERVSQVSAQNRLIMVSASFLVDHEEPLLHKVMNNALYRSLGNIYFRCNIPHSEVWVLAEKKEDMCVIREKSPV